MKLTSGGVVSLGDRRSTAGFNGRDLGDRSTESRELCRGVAESTSDLAAPLLDLLTRGVAGDTLAGVGGGTLAGVADKVDLPSRKSQIT